MTDELIAMLESNPSTSACCRALRLAICLEQWPDKDGATNCHVLHALVNLAEERDSLQIRTSLKDLAERAGLRTTAAVGRAVGELAAANWMTGGLEEMAAVEEQVRVDLDVGFLRHRGRTLENLDLLALPYNTVSRFLSHRAFRKPYGLTASSALAYAAICDGQSTKRDITKTTAMTAGSFTFALRRLTFVQMVEVTEDGFAPGPVTPDDRVRHYIDPCETEAEAKAKLRRAGRSRAKAALKLCPEDLEYLAELEEQAVY